MNLSINLDETKVRLELVKNRQVIDFEELLYYHDLDGVLITVLDKLLKRNKLDAKALKSYKILGNLGQNSTSYKIVAVLVEGLKVRD